MVKALLSTRTVAASTYLDPLAKYVRPDGTVIGTGADLAEGDGRLDSGPWQNELGVYGSRQTAFTGAPAPNVLAPSMASDCNDWTASTGNPISGDIDNIAFWYSGGGVLGTSCNSTNAAVYCVEQ